MALEKSSLLDDEKLQGLDPENVEEILVHFLEHQVNVSPDDIPGLKMVKEIVRETFIIPALFPQFFSGFRRPPKAVLLFGPEGDEKGMIARMIASESHSTFFSLSASSLKSKWAGESEKLLQTLFTIARVRQPSIIFIDEIDYIFPLHSPKEKDDVDGRRLMTALLMQLDNINSDDIIGVVATSNRPHELDYSLRKRLQKRIFVPLPDETVREQLIKRLLSNQSHSLSDEEILALVRLTKGYSDSDLQTLCRESALRVVEGSDSIDPLLMKGSLLSFKDFVETLDRSKPTASEEEIAGYVEWNENFGSYPIELKCEN